LSQWEISFPHPSDRTLTVVTRVVSALFIGESVGCDHDTWNGVIAIALSVYCHNERPLNEKPFIFLVPTGHPLKFDQVIAATNFSVPPFLFIFYFLWRRIFVRCPPRTTRKCFTLLNPSPGMGHPKGLFALSRVFKALWQAPLSSGGLYECQDSDIPPGSRFPS
jgi:hypothetical protein